ncbi:MAG: Rrf2 family transcriptional regulator [Phycisphaeraceae bacterium]|nr:Rrf2 family transcriptional regulator [Phycisphaeraceae bacterium]
MISRQVAMAAVSMGLIERAGPEGLQIPDLVKLTGISRPTLGKIINALARKKLVRTQRGVGGGVRLSRAGEQVSLYDLCVAFDDPVIECHCSFGFGHCAEEGPCPPGCICVAQHAKQLEYLKATSVQDVAETMEPRLKKAARRARRGRER